MKKDSIEKFCKYCESASLLSDEDAVLCERYGVVSSAHKCRRFRYDPLKRSPKRMSAEPELEFVDISDPAAPAEAEADAEKAGENE